jgi:hypothetical protein
VLSPEVLGPAAADLWTIADRFSSSYLLATAANVIRELGELQARASAAKKRLATLTLQTDIRFASAAQRSAFTQELTQAIAALTAKYHDEKSPSGRRFKLVAAAYPATNEQPSKPKRTEDS